MKPVSEAEIEEIDSSRAESVLIKQNPICRKTVDQKSSELGQKTVDSRNQETVYEYVQKKYTF
ncbi:hypothetical protein J2S78_000832 [Salibacterium salarium]|nr:hypothetical protein [Salibacterium salarium]